MKTSKLTFTNRDGVELAARLEWPANEKPHHFALFAHCFTCNKNLGAVRNISRALANAGIAVLRFDFTGLGESEGDFEHTNFSGNVEDLVDAASFLAVSYQAPSLLVGHSLGGAAVVWAGRQISSVQAVVTIGAPAEPTHVTKLLSAGIEEIQKEGAAEVCVGGRPFTIRKQFLDDLREHSLESIAGELRKPILIAHSPQDMIVSIDNAAKLYTAAHHPKSFLSLDGADHLLSDKQDSEYVGQVIATWAKRYLPFSESERLQPELQVVAHMGEGGFTTQIQARTHGIVADEPAEAGGDDFGMSPYELVSSALGACTTMTLRMYAERKGWDLQEVTVHLEHGKVHSSDARTGQRKIDRFQKIIALTGDLDDVQRNRLLEIAAKCPVHRTLEGPVEIESSLSS